MLKLLNYQVFGESHEKVRFRALDGLRGLAVLIVLLSHTSNQNLYFHEALDFKRIGHIGVYLFFVLSAYLLDRQIINAFLKNDSMVPYWKNYFLRRFLRIYPLFFIALLIHFLFTHFGVITVIKDPKDIFDHLFLLKGESVFWSIPVEFKYYLVSPFIIWACRNIFRWNMYLIVMMILLLIIASTLLELKTHQSDISTIKYLPVFLVGTLISIFEVRRGNIFNNISYIRIFDFLGLVSLTVVILTFPVILVEYFHFRSISQDPLFFIFYATMWGLLLISGKQSQGIIKQLLELKFLRFIGKISFSIYLLHMPLLLLVKDNFYSVPTEFKIYLFFGLTLFVSLISYLVIEKPLSNIRINRAYT